MKSTMEEKDRRQRQKEKETEEKERETKKERERETETEKDRNRERERERERERDRERGREGEYCRIGTEVMIVWALFLRSDRNELLFLLQRETSRLSFKVCVNGSVRLKSQH